MDDPKAPASYDFQLRIATLLRDGLATDYAFCLLGREGVDRATQGCCLDAAGPSYLRAPGPPLRAMELEGVLDPNETRRAHRLDELFSLAVSLGRAPANLAWIHEGVQVGCDFAAQAIVLLKDETRSFGVAGLGWLGTHRRFGDQDLSVLECVAPVIAAGASTQLAAHDLECEVAVMRVLGPGSGIEVLVDLDEKRVLWSSESESTALEPGSNEERALVSSVERRMLATTSDEMIPTPIRLPMGFVVAAAELTSTSPCRGRCAAARIQSFDDCVDPLKGLSSRERTVARFLVNGYAAPNIAAITGLAEYTVRTYVRRLYKKLDVCNRADLVRRIVGTAAAASRPEVPIS